MKVWEDHDDTLGGTLLPDEEYRLMMLEVKAEKAFWNVVWFCFGFLVGCVAMYFSL